MKFHSCSALTFRWRHKSRLSLIRFLRNFQRWPSQWHKHKTLTWQPTTTHNTTTRPTCHKCSFTFCLVYHFLQNLPLGSFCSYGLNRRHWRKWRRATINKNLTQSELSMGCSSESLYIRAEVLLSSDLFIFIWNLIGWLSELLTTADEFLLHWPTSVINKTPPAVSGSRRDKY